MNEMGRSLRDPDFSFPRNLGEIPRHNRPCRESCDVYEPSSRTPKQVLQSVSPLSIDRAVTGHRLGKDKPVPLCVVDDGIRYFPVPIHLNAQAVEQLLVKVADLFSGIANVDQLAADQEPRH